MKRHSLFLRLLLIFGLTFLGVFFSIALGFRVARPERPSEFMRRNLEAYSEYLATEIGNPPDLDRARALHQRTGLEIWIQTPGKPEFHTTDSPRPRRIFKVLRNQTLFEFAGPWGFPQAESPIHGIVTAIGLSLATLIACAAMVRRTFLPLDWMKKAARSYADGDWNARIALTGPAELSELSALINTMAQQISGHMESMRALLASVSHELRSPLARMRVGLEGISSPELRESLKEEIHLLDHLTESILSSERARFKSRQLQLTQTDLGALLNDLLKTYGDAFKVQDLAPGKIRRNVDPDQMTLALRGLLQNALTHGKDLLSHRKPEVSLSLEADGAGWITLRDFGPGISEQALSHLGEPFFQADSSRPHQKTGFGFGISVSMAIFRAHGWHLQAVPATAPERGTTFRIGFPRANT